MFFKQSFNKLHFSHFSSDFLAQLANEAGTDVANVKNVIIWGNHSSTQFPDAAHATINGKIYLKLKEKAGTLRLNIFLLGIII